MGHAPHIFANAASERIRSLLSPAVTSSSAAMSSPTPTACTTARSHSPRTRGRATSPAGISHRQDERHDIDPIARGLPGPADRQAGPQPVPLAVAGENDLGDPALH